MGVALLAGIVFVAFGVEAAMGFGCTVLAVTFAAPLFPLDRLLPLLVSLNLVVSTYIVLRHRAAVDWTILLGRLLPLMAVGMGAGMLAFRLASGRWLKLGFGLFVVVLAILELARMARRQGRVARPLGRWQSVAVLLGAGVTHGLYASGGPLAVFFASRQLSDKGQFRSTLSALWLVLNAILLGSFLAHGALGRQTLTSFLILLAPEGAGILAGEWLHGRVNEAAFRVLIFLLLLAGGMTLVASTLGDIP